MPTKKEPSYSDLKQELDELLVKLQREDIDVDEALGLYERGMELTKQLEAMLKETENKITKLKTKFD